MKTIGIEQTSFTRSSFEQICMNNIKNIYQHASKWDDQQNLKDIIEAVLLSTPYGVTYNSTNVHMTSTPVKKPSARKSLFLFTTILDVKPKTAKRSFVAENPNAKPWKWVISCGPRKQNEKGIQKSTSISNVIYMHG